MKTINKIIVEFFKIPEANISDSLSAKDIPDWDSMNYLLFIAELEKEYGVTFTMDEVLSVESIGGVKALLLAKGIVL